MTPEDKRLRASIAANARWAKTSDRKAAATATHDALNTRLAREYGIPDDLKPEEREKRLAYARSAYFKGLALKSARARRKAAQAVAEAERAEAELGVEDLAS